MKKGKLIVIEGTDGSGKETQSKRLEQELLNRGIKAIRLSFPSYGEKSAGPVEMYLSGELGDRDSISPFEISMYYAIDRSCTMRWLNIEEELLNGVWVICDRYAESNIVYQTSQLKSTTDKLLLADKIMDLEYNKLKIPVPDYVIFLKLRREISKSLIDKRGERKDIHETDENLMNKVYESGLFWAERLKWNIIDCEENGAIRSIEDISKDIQSILL